MRGTAGFYPATFVKPKLTAIAQWLPFDKHVLAFWVLAIGILAARLFLGIDRKTMYMLPLLFCIFLCVILYRQWNVLVDLFLSYLTVEGMLKILSDYHPLMHVGADLLAITVGFLWLISTKRQQKGNVWPPMYGLVFFYCAWVVVMVFNPYAISLFASLASFKLHLTMLVLFFLGYSQCRSLDQIERALLILALLGTFISIVGLIQYLRGPDSFYILSPIYRERSEAIGGDFRPWSTTNGPGGISWGAFIATPCWLALINFENISRNRKIAYIAMLCMGLMGLLLSQSRIMILGVLVGAAVFIGMCGRKVLKRTMMTATLLVLVGSISYFAVTSLATKAKENEDDSISELYVEGRMQSLLRSESYNKYTGNIFNTLIGVSVNYPLGQGLNRVGPGAAQFFPEGGGPLLAGLYENTISATISELGFPGLLMQVALLVGVLMRVWRTVKFAGQSRRLILLGAAISGYLLACWFVGMKGTIFFGGILAAIYWYLMGLGLSLAEQVQVRNSQSDLTKDLEAKNSMKTLMYG